MRPSASVHSGMPTGKTWMGWWGDVRPSSSLFSPSFACLSALPVLTRLLSRSQLGGPKQVGISSYGTTLVPSLLRPLGQRADWS